MRGLIKDLWNDGFGRVILALTGLLCVMLLCLFVIITDHIGPTYQTTGHIRDMSFRYAHDEYGSVLVGKIIVPTVNRIPDEWFLDITTPKGDDWFVSDHAPWGWQQPGKDVVVGYKRGLWTGTFRLSWIGQP